MWLRRELEKLNIPVELPLMPHPWAPDYADFKREFEKYSVAGDTILIGHSCGCAFLVRWLGETKKSVSKLILVAPWKIPDREDGSDFAYYSYDIDGTIAERVKEIFIFTSDNEEEEGKESAKIFHKALGGELIELKNHGHFREVDMGSVEFPELLNEVLKTS